MDVVMLLMKLFTFYVSPSTIDMVPASMFDTPQVALAFENHAEENAYIRHFEALSGVTLYMPLDTLLDIKGAPLDITADPWQDSLEYHYADLSVGVAGSSVIYIHVEPEQARQYGLSINETLLDPVNNNLQELLGKPDFVADDGDVYLRGNAALKIYRNMQTGIWEGIDLFDANLS